MLMIPARLVRSESFWAIVKVRSPHTGPEPGYPRHCQDIQARLLTTHYSLLGSDPLAASRPRPPTGSGLRPIKRGRTLKLFTV